MKSVEDAACREVTCRRPRSGTYSRTVINLTAQEERKLRLIATRFGMEKAGDPSLLYGAAARIELAAIAAK